MEDFAKKFLEEATDLINELERSVLELEESPDNDEIVNDVFRIMHSLKGGGAMFGFTQISDFTHNMENIYDEVRANERKLTKELLDITFESVDHLRNLLNSGDAPEVLLKNKSLRTKIESLISTESDSQPITENNESKDASQDLYYVKFTPHSNFFDFGNNPFFLIDDLHDLGKAISFASAKNVPAIDEYNHTLSYVSWEILLVTEAGKEEIEDVFIFAEEECSINIIKLAANFTLSEKDLKIFSSEAFNGQSLDLLQLKKQIAMAAGSDGGRRTTEGEHLKKFTKESEISSIRIATEKIDDYLNLVSELVTAQATLKLLLTENKNTRLAELSESIENITYRIRDNALSISLIPIENIIVRFRRLVRDLSGTFEKNIKFVTEGTDTRIDKTLLQIITDPMMHILRNAIDHGIENTDERLIHGKDEQGKIILRAYNSGSNVHIEIEDDGRGIDSEVIRKKGVEKGLLTENVRYTETEIFDVLFKPGFSTAKKVTDISGRGVGMDVLRRKVADVRGDVKIESELGKGTKITLMLPMSLSIIDGLLLKVNKNQFIVPLSDISKIHEIDLHKLTESYNNLAVIDDKQVPFINLREGLQLGGDNPELVQLLEIKYRGTKVGLVFDEIVGEYQAVLKPLSKLYRGQKMMSSASVLGDGSVALVLDTGRLISEISKEQDLKIK